MRKCWNLALVAGTLALVLPAPLAAQERIPAASSRPAVTTDTVSDASPNEVVPLTLMDGPFDRSDYILGPGDGVDVSIFGEVNRFHRLTVTPEGTLLIPSVGVANVRGLNLNQTQERVGGVVGRQYRNVEVNVSLSRIRTFKIFLLGQVPNPGVRVASAATRISEIIPIADDSVIRRTVSLRHTNGTTERVDLLRFVALGDIEANPRLREGDAVFIPALDQTVQAFGGFATKGKFEYRPGETLSDFIRILNGGPNFPPQAADTIRVSRITPNQSREVHLFTREQALNGAGRTFELRPFDAIYLPVFSNYGMQPSASVRGQVVRPGTYPIRPDTTSVAELVQMAGGFTSEASPAEATLTRSPRAAPRKSELETIPTEALSQEEIRILQARATGDPNAVVLDFDRTVANRDAIYNQKIANGDVLDIPRIRREVTVLGAVTRPGIVSFVEGNRAGYFVSLAGGYTKQADRSDAVILRSRTGARFEADDDVVLEPGDQIVVPFKEHISLTERLTRTQTIVMTISSLIFTYLGAKQILE